MVIYGVQIGFPNPVPFRIPFSESPSTSASESEDSSYSDSSDSADSCHESSSLGKKLDLDRELKALSSAETLEVLVAQTSAAFAQLLIKLDEKNQKTE